MNRIHISLLLVALFLVLAPTAPASTTWYVNGVSGNDSENCSSAETACKTIGHAISLAASGDSIIVAPAIYTENLTINFSLNLIGSGARTTILDGGGVKRVINISTGNVTLSGLTVRNGAATPGYGGIGGGIYNAGNLFISASTITGNLASAVCPPSGCTGGGGGIYNSGRLTISMTTVAGNTTEAGCVYSQFAPCLSTANGGGIFNRGTVVLSNSTIGANTARHIANGFAFHNVGGIANIGNVTISNSTISGNTPHGIASNQGFSVTIQNTIVSNNAGSNCSSAMVSNGYNLSSDGTCNFGSRGDLNSHDPLLGPLQNNGGPTATMALLPGSPAIDAGNPAGCTDGLGHLLKTDQRGMPRPDKEDSVGCDMGAYESPSDGFDVVPGLNVSPSSLSFGDPPIGSTSTETLTLTNGGSTSISGISLTVSSLFNLSDGTCGTALAAGASCVIGIGFTPTGPGAAVGTLTISSSSPSNPTLTVPLSGTGIGTGIGPIPSLAPSSLSFGNVLAGTISPPQTATLTNVGNAPLTILSMVYNDNAPGGLFLSFHTATCAPNLSVAPGASCTISIEFEANAAASGPQAGSVIVNFAAGGSATLQLSANVIL